MGKTLKRQTAVLAAARALVAKRVTCAEMPAWGLATGDEM